MPKAYVVLREELNYRMAAFITGLTKLGYEVVRTEPAEPVWPDEVAVIWNKTINNRTTVEQTQRGGGALIIAENGYYGKDAEGRSTIALALDGHCGSGRWYVGDRSQFDALGIEFKPWRKPGTARTILVADQRGIGSPQMASPRNFSKSIQQRLMGAGWAPRLREHPGKNAPPVPLMDDLQDVRAVVVWSSNCATTALIEGVPTFYCAPHIITKGAALRFNLNHFKAPPEPEREEAFIRMSWAQAFVEEIESGEALERLIAVNTGGLPACQKGLGL